MSNPALNLTIRQLIDFVVASQSEQFELGNGYT